MRYPLLILLLCAASFLFAQNPIEIPLTLDNQGLYELPATLNGVVKLNFILDSGATDVQINSKYAKALVKSGTLTDKDRLPQGRYLFANGSYNKADRFILRSLEVGGYVVQNVKCYIVTSSDAMVLLGESALSQMGKISIDYSNLTFTIEPGDSNAVSNARSKDSEWPKADQDSFMQDCIHGASTSLIIGRDKFCRCMLESTMAKYPDPADAAALSRQQKIAMEKDCK